jgi:anti-sigma-K factor RskA
VTIDQDKDVLAAEYVLGTLGPDERAEAQALIAIDSGFAEVVRGWERRLGELSAMVDPVDPPADMWNRIQAGIAVSNQSAQPAPPVVDAVKEPSVEAPTTALATAPTETPPAAAAAVPDAAVAATAAAAPAAAKPAEPEVPAAPLLVPVPVSPPSSDAEIIQLSRRVRTWRAATMGTGALAACFLAAVLVRDTNPDLFPVPLQPKPKVVEVVKTVEVPSPRPAEFVAVFQKDDASPAFLLTFDLDKRSLTVRRVGAEQQAGKSYELWLVSDKYPAPRSLGVIGAAPYTVRQAAAEYDPVIINRATYAISLEPEGGSPTGAPTGPVLYHGRLVQTTAPDFPARTP